ncbi:hypothetical protein GCM10009738_66460 [Kitasatospora viridis]
MNSVVKGVGFSLKQVQIRQIDEAKGMALCVDPQGQYIEVALSIRRTVVRPMLGQTWLIDRSMGTWTLAALVDAAFPADPWPPQPWGQSRQAPGSYVPGTYPQQTWTPFPASVWQPVTVLVGPLGQVELSIYGVIGAAAGTLRIAVGLTGASTAAAAAGDWQLAVAAKDGMQRSMFGVISGLAPGDTTITPHWYTYIPPGTTPSGATHDMSDLRLSARGW